MRACHRRRPEPRRASTAAARASRPDVRPEVVAEGIHFSTLRSDAQGQCRGCSRILWGCSGVRSGGEGANGLHAPFYAHTRRLDRLMVKLSYKSLSRVPAPRLRACACAVLLPQCTPSEMPPHANRKCAWWTVAERLQSLPMAEGIARVSSPMRLEPAWSIKHQSIDSLR